jgi:hypothetical protein
MTISERNSATRWWPQNRGLNQVRTRWFSKKQDRLCWNTRLIKWDLDWAICIVLWTHSAMGSSWRTSMKRSLRKNFKARVKFRTNLKKFRKNLRKKTTWIERKMLSSKISKKEFLKSKRKKLGSEKYFKKKTMLSKRRGKSREILSRTSPKRWQSRSN